MSRPVNAVPPLPYPGRGSSTGELAAFDQDLTRALHAYLSELARRTNENLPKDGSEAATGMITIINSLGGSSDVYGGRLLRLINFTPGIMFEDLSTSANEVIICNDGGQFKVFGVADGTTTTTLLFTIGTTGLVTTLGQIAFPATQNASSNANTLDDYEEGTWTPVLTFATPGDLSVAYSTQVGRYQKVGNRVHLMFTIVTTTFTHTTAAGECRITGVPFTSVNIGGPIWAGALSWGNAITPPGGRTQVNIELAANSSTLRPIASGPGVARSTLVPADMPTGNVVVLIGNLTYEAAN